MPFTRKLGFAVDRVSDHTGMRCYLVPFTLVAQSLQDIKSKVDENRAMHQPTPSANSG